MQNFVLLDLAVKSLMTLIPKKKNREAKLRTYFPTRRKKNGKKID